MADAFGSGDDAPDVDAQARAKAKAWTMPGFKPFDQSERSADAGAGDDDTVDEPPADEPPAEPEPAAEPEQDLPSFMD